MKKQTPLGEALPTIGRFWGCLAHVYYALINKRCTGTHSVATAAPTDFAPQP